MSEYKAGFIGCGNMGFALARAVAAAVGAENVAISCSTYENAVKKAAILGATAQEAAAIAQKAEFLFIGVKPNMLSAVSEELCALSERSDDFIIVSMLAGVSIETLKKHFGGNGKFIRIMPNTPAAVGEGMTLMCTSDNVSAAEAEEFKSMMKAAGAVDELPEALIDAASAVSGCGPAFLYMFADALADGGVFCGLKKEKALLYALSTIKGACTLALSEGKHPAQLKDEVCSPGGSTIEGVRALSEGGFSAAAMNAVIKAFEKTKELGKSK